MKKTLYTLAILFFGVAFTYAQDQGIALSGEELFGALRARQIGPALMSGRITDIEGHPSDPKVLYIGAAGGGVWKTVDGGVIFRSVFDKHNQSIGALAIDPQDPDKTLWVGTGEVWTRNSVSIGDGIYKTADGGENWKKMGLENSERISGICIHPKNNQVLYVGVLGALWSASTDRGVYKTTDGGTTWQKIFSIDENTGCSELVMDPSNPDILYAAFWEFRRSAYSFNSGGFKSGLYKSTDAGATWQKIHKGFPEGKLGRIAMAAAPSQPQTLYAVIESEQKEKTGLYKSSDAGANWQFLNGDFELSVRPFYFSRIVVDPKNPEIVYKAGLSGSVSRDGGKTFRNLGSMHSDIHDFWVHIDNSDMLFVATDGGLYRSWNGGTVMEMVKNLPLSQFYHVSIDNATPYHVYGGLQDNGSWYGPSESPGGIENRDWNSVGYGDGFRVLRHPSKSNIVYSEMQGAENIWRYDTERRQTKIIKPYPVAGDPKLRFNWNTPIQTSKHQADRLYVGSQFLHKSDDMGENWVKISPDLTTNDKTKQMQESSGGLSADNSGAENHCTIFSIAESPLDEKVIWVGTDDGNVQVTTNGGSSWTLVSGAIPGLPKNTWAYKVEPSNFDKQTCYVVFDGHTRGDFKPYVYVTKDLGKTWSALDSRGIEGFARSIKEDYVNKDLLYLGTELGLYITVDGGKNWAKFSNNMPSASVHYIALHPTTHDLVLGTHGRGIIIIDDISPLRQVTKAVLESPVHFYTMKPTVLRDETPFTEGGDAGEFAGPNPDPRAKIVYYLKSRHTFGKMSLEIIDKEGKVIADLAPGKSKGINIVYWNYNLKAPKVAVGKTFSFGAFSTPRVLEGTYRVRMVKGKDTIESQIVLIADPKSMHTQEDRAQQFTTTMKLHGMSETLAYLVDQADAMHKSLTELASKTPTLKKQSLVLQKQIEAWKENVVVMKGDNYVGSAEPQLREKIASLYSEVAAYYGKPSEAQLLNLKLMEEKLADAKTKFEIIKKAVLVDFNKKVKGQNLEEIKLRTFEEFKKADS